MKTSTVVEDLMQIAQAGDMDAENELFSKLSARFLSSVKLILRSRYPYVAKIMCEMEFEDIVQDALIIVKKKYRDLRFESGFFSWAHSVLHNTARNHVQKILRNKKKETGLEEDISAAPGDLEKEFETQELLANIKICIQKMDKICKKILMVFFKNGSREDVIKLFPGIPIGTIDNKIFRCRNKLKTLLNAETGAL